jgi:hypothetical protein
MFALSTWLKSYHHSEAVGKRPSAARQARGPEQSRRAALPSSLVTAAYFYVRLIPRDFGSLAYGHFPSASQKSVFRQSQRFAWLKVREFRSAAFMIRTSASSLFRARPSRSSCLGRSCSRASVVCGGMTFQSFKSCHISSLA